MGWHPGIGLGAQGAIVGFDGVLFFHSNPVEARRERMMQGPKKVVSVLLGLIVLSAGFWITGAIVRRSIRSRGSGWT